MIVAGIDPGTTGGVAVVDTDGGCETIMMPTMKAGKQTVVDGKALTDFVVERAPDFVVIEEVHSMPRQGVVSTFTFGANYGGIISSLQARGIPWKLVLPQEWKKAWGLFKANKDASRDLAICTFPNAHRQFWRVKDDGRAEAALIAGYHLNMHMVRAAS